VASASRSLAPRVVPMSSPLITALDGRIAGGSRTWPPPDIWHDGSLRDRHLSGEVDAADELW
jgi:hypothetical protein